MLGYSRYHLYVIVICYCVSIFYLYSYYIFFRTRQYNQVEFHYSINLLQIDTLLRVKAKFLNSCIFIMGRFLN